MTDGVCSQGKTMRTKTINKIAYQDMLECIKSRRFGRLPGCVRRFPVHANNVGLGRGLSLNK